MTHWTCRRQTAGRKCGYRNPGIKKKCARCGAAKPAKRAPTHLRALNFDYDHYVKLTGGDYCAICLRPRTDADRRHHRDHDHRTGQPRGLLCFRCNTALPAWMTPEWLRAAADYLERTAA